MRRHDQTKKRDNYNYRDKDNAKDKYIQRAPSKSDPRDMTRPKKEKITMTNTETKTMRKTNTFKEHPQRAIQETCNLRDI